MTVRITFRCSRCGSKSFRPSTQWTFKDTFLHKFGVRPQRCFQCRARFYIFRPTFLPAFFRVLAGTPAAPAAAPALLQEANEAAFSSEVLSHSERTIKLGDGRPQRARGNAAG